MIVILNNQEPLTVKDDKGNILFQYIPQKNEKINFNMPNIVYTNKEDLIETFKTTGVNESKFIEE